MKVLFPLAVAMALAPAVAGAVTISPGDTGGNPVPTSVSPNSSFDLDFEITAPLAIDILVTASGFSGGDDLDLSSIEAYGLTDDVETLFVFGSLASGVATLSFDAFTDFTLSFIVGAAATNVSFTYQFETSAIPAPAAGILLGTALLGGAGLTASRKRKAANA